MIRISANISKKVPMHGVEYSSQQFGASIESEISSADTPEGIKARIRQMYALLNHAVDEQIAASPKVVIPSTGNQAQPAKVAVSTTPRWKLNGANGKNGTGHQPVPATAAQVKAIGAICTKMNLDLNEVLAEYKVQETKDLTVKQASKVIDDLKKEQSARR